MCLAKEGRRSIPEQAREGREDKEETHIFCQCLYPPNSWLSCILLASHAVSNDSGHKNKVS